MVFHRSRVFLRCFAVLIAVLLMAGTVFPVNADLAKSKSSLDALPRDALAAFTRLDLIANIETAGVVVSGVSLPGKAELSYRRSGDLEWRSAHPLMRIDDGRLAGSLFGLSPSTTYEVRVMDAGTEISGLFTTQPEELPFAPSAVIYVNANASSGGDGTSTAPFQTIQEGVNRAGPGTQVLVADGLYRENVTFPASGTAGNWIQVKAQGGGAILDGSEVLAGAAWASYEPRPNVWFVKIGAPIKYLARDQKRFYNYDDFTGLTNGIGHGGVEMREGWYYDPSTTRLYVRTLKNPSLSTWNVPRLDHAFDVAGRDWIWIEGFEMRYYGAGSSGCGVCTVNASHVVIRKNRIRNMQLGIFINWTGGDDRGNDTRIEYNEIYDPPVNEWAWKAVKGTSMEGTAIVLRGHIGAIVRGNDIRNFFNGIYTGSSAALDSPALAFDADIYNNRIRLVSDDGLEPEGACVNHRFRNNTVDSMLVGISLAPVTYGPVWVMRSTFTNFSGTSIKWDLNSDGIVLIYHNTSWTNAGGLNAMSMLRPAHNTVMRNNIFQGNGYAFEEPFSGSTGHDWDYDNWYTTRASPHFKWENINYATITDLCRGTRLECNGHENPPSLVNPGGGNFTLLSASPNIDRGILIPGINDGFYGNAPDIGAFESTFGAPPPATDTPPVPTETPAPVPTDTPLPMANPPVVTGILRADPNPTSADVVRFTVGFSESVVGVDSADFVLTVSGVSEAVITDVSGMDNLYLVTVKTGRGNGSIRLDVIDNDSILNTSGLPLGGAGIGNGSFSAGEVYTVARNNPARVIEVFFSNGGNDGWVLESQENSNRGGSMNARAQTFRLGDDGRNSQYRTILDFSTGTLPDNAVITQAILMIQLQGVVGINPFSTHHYIWIDIRKGAFGSFGPFTMGALQASDFQAPASAYSVGTIQNNPVGNWYWSLLDAKAHPHINLKGPTQLRLGFLLDDNNNKKEDYLSFFSGDFTGAIDRPTLLVEYYVP